MNIDRELEYADAAGAPLRPAAFAAAAAIISAAIMLLLGAFGAAGVYEGAVAMMQQWHLFFTPTVGGTIAGMLEGAIVSYVVAYAFARAYNGLTRT